VCSTGDLSLRILVYPWFYPATAMSFILEMANLYYPFLMVFKTSTVFSSTAGVNLMIPYLFSTSSTNSSISSEATSENIAPSIID
jgi:hypothetical protein